MMQHPQTSPSVALALSWQAPVDSPPRQNRKADRKARRAEAQRVIRHLGDLVVRHRTNDTKGSHITLWLSETRRVEWWPGTMRWRDPSGGMTRGTADDLVAFLRAEQPARGGVVA